MELVSFKELKTPFLNHFFSPAKNAESLLNKFGAIQIDPLTIVSKNHLLVIASRNEKLTDDCLDDLYDQKKIVEVFAKERCIVPSSDAYLYASRLQKNKEHWWSSKPLKEHPKEVREVLSLVKDRGRVVSSDFTIKQWHTDHSWRSRNIYTSILGALHETGELIISSRSDRKLSYSLPSEGLWLPPKKMSNEEIRLERYKRYLDSVLITDTRDTFAGFERSTVKERKTIFEQLIQTGFALPVDNVKFLTIVSKKSLNRAMKIKNICLPTFVPPLDNSIWHRSLIEDLWNFRYRWEIYTPQARREFGPFAMPLVLENGFFGPVDFKFDRQTNELIGKLSKSPLAKEKAAIRSLIEEAAQKLVKSIGANKIKWS